MEKTTHQKPKTNHKKATHVAFWPLIFNVAKLLVWTAVVLIACQYAVTFGLYFILGKERLLTPVWTTVCNALIYALATFLIIYVPVKFFKKQKPTKEQLGFKNFPTWTDIGLAPAGFVIYFILAAILITIFSQFPFFDANEAQELGYDYLNSGLDRVVAFFALCIVAPISEEIIFRGWLYDKLRNVIPGKKLSVILSNLLVSILFGIMHGQWNVGVNVFAMSLVLCELREITGTIHSGILLHILKNTLAFVLIYILGIS